ncbi:hypothetical protein [Pandoraea terrigena]|uniref:Uncharacterized protein n=1 Tax=Pandoraea terrigena TaxID=2508292 RepID=A0A5E4YWP1_9BURK|nr:hypothetical protein [Pandoraea terrigena]VVE52745.1 hypothetical protein PTE31013_04837 [Pandoraea terrigena]
MQKLELLDWPQLGIGAYLAVADTPLFTTGHLAVYELAFEDDAINVKRRGMDLGRFRHVAIKGARLYVFDVERRCLKASSYTQFPA